MDEGTRGELLDRLAGAIESESVTTSLRVAVEAFEQTLERAGSGPGATGSTAKSSGASAPATPPPSSSISHRPPGRSRRHRRPQRPAPVHRLEVHHTVVRCGAFGYKMGMPDTTIPAADGTPLKAYLAVPAEPGPALGSS